MVLRASRNSEQAFAEEKARQAHERELEVARLRAAQEKILDRRSEMDELRACRLFHCASCTCMRLVVSGICTLTGQALVSLIQTHALH